MSNYTTQLRFICESKSGVENIEDVIEVTRQAVKHIYDNDVLALFPNSYYYNNTCMSLQQKILLHFYTHEIGFETFGLWKLKFNQRLREIMPYYQKLYETTEMHYTLDDDCNLSFNLFDNVDVIETTRNVTTENIFSNTTNNTTTEYNGSQLHTFSENGTNTNQTTGNSTEKNAFSNTPQGKLSDVENNSHLTDFRNIQNTNSSNVNDTIKRSGDSSDSFKDRKDITSNKINSDGNRTANNDVTKRIKGKNTSQTNTAVIVEFRESIINIDNMVFKDLENLFMMIY